MDERRGDEAREPQHGYDFSGVDGSRVYTLREAGETVGMTYSEIWQAQRKGSIRVVRSTWNEKRIYVRGSELLRVLKEEFVPYGKVNG